MKKLFIIVFLFISVILYSQPENNVFRLKVSKEEASNWLGGIDGPLFYLVFTIEQRLDNYKKGGNITYIADDRRIIQEIREHLNIDMPASLRSKTMPKKEVEIWLERWGGVQESLCIDCYEKELSNYAIRQEKKQVEERVAKQVSDSVKKAKTDSIATSNKVNFPESKNPYRTLEINLDIMSKNLQQHRFTVFRGLDLNFADSRFSRYLQDRGLTIDDKSMVVTPTMVSIKYVPKVFGGSASGWEDYITVKYTVKDDSDPHKVPYIKMEKAHCLVIQKVEIMGTADIVIPVFVQYWDFKMTIGGYKRGEMASYQALGDHVVLSGTNKPGICKITIDKGSIEADYYSTFNIK